jgi:energy-coupling factor transporter ATP-binding protein EcfA2
MAEVRLDPDRFADRSPLSLSEGEKRRAALAGALVEPPHILLLDEPTAGLDPDGRRTLAAAIHGLRERGRTVIIASHDLDFVGAVADRVVVLTRDEEGSGRTFAQAGAMEILRNARLLAEAGLPSPEFVRLERAFRSAGLLAPTSVRDQESLLDALARGAAGQPLNLPPAGRR